MNRNDGLEEAATVSDLLLTLIRHLTAGEDVPLAELPLALFSLPPPMVAELKQAEITQTVNIRSFLRTASHPL